MNGKKIKVNDYKFTYGQETCYLNVYGAFKNTQNGNKYVVYSYENKNKLYYGSFFIRSKEAVIMSSKEKPKEIIKEFIDSILNNIKNDKFEKISLDDITSIEIIDECQIDYNIDIQRLYDLTIPQSIKKEPKETTKKNRMISISWIFFILFLVVVVAFFLINPEVIIGKDKVYNCTKSYLHKSLPASVAETISITVNGKGNIKNIDVTKDYSFNNVAYYNEFKEKSYYYQYMEEGDTYKFIDNNYTYRVFSNLGIEEDTFLPTEEKELLQYYQDKEYTCEAVDIDE